MSRRNRERAPSKAWEKTEELITDDARAFIRLSGDLLDVIEQLMREQGLKPSDLARKMGKKPSEIHKFLKLGYNLTIKTIGKLEAALGAPLLVTPRRHQARREASLFGGSVELDHYFAIGCQATVDHTRLRQQVDGKKAEISSPATIEPQSEQIQGNTASTSYAMAA